MVDQAICDTGLMLLADAEPESEEVEIKKEWYLIHWSISSIF
jgi:hypothetical protein